jgi:glycine/D-amino acid oxidase-like deaminating enzyme
MRRSERALFASGHVDLAESSWTADSPSPSYPRLEGEARADVVVIGAGLAGGSLALHLAEGGAGVALVEAKEPGWGASGRNAGHSVPYREVGSALGRLPDRGEAFLELLREGGGIPYEIAAKYDIDCDAVQGGYLQVAHIDKLVPVAERKARKWSDRGFAMRFVDRDEVAELTGSEVFLGGVIAEKGGRINPLRFTRGMVATAQRSGARVFAGSPVESVAGEGTRWRVSTSNGSLLADRVVACTNAYTTTCVPEIEKAWCPLVAFCITMKPLPEPLRSSILPSGAAICQVPTGYHPMVVDQHGRIVKALLPSAIRPQKSGPPLAWARRWLHRTFPQTRAVDLEVDAYWTGLTAWSTDSLPRIYEVAPGLHALMCFSGEGNVIAPLLGRQLAEALIANDLGRLALPVVPPSAPFLRNRYDIALRGIAMPLARLAERLRLF